MYKDYILVMSEKEIRWSDIHRVVMEVKDKVPDEDRENAETWDWTNEPGGPLVISSARLPEGYTLEDLLKCSEEDLKALGLFKKFHTSNNRANFYHFKLK